MSMGDEKKSCDAPQNLWFAALGLRGKNLPILAKMVSIDINMSLSYEKKT